MPSDPIVCIAGKNRNAVEAAQHFRMTYPRMELRVAVNGTETGYDTWQPSLRRWAEESAVPICKLEELYSVRELIFISLEFDRLLKPSAFASNRLFNLHFSLLPEYKGMFTSIWPILDGRDYSGVTLHCIDEGIDTGDIIAQERFDIGPNDTSRQLYEQYVDASVSLFKEWLPRLLSGDFPIVPQPATGSSYRSKRSINFPELRIDLQQTAECVHNQIRAFAFPEYQLARVLGHSIGRSEILPARSKAKPGTLLAETPDLLEIATVDFDVRLHKDPLDSFIAACEARETTLAARHLHRLSGMEVRNAKGWTPLMVAAYHNLPEIAVVLLGRGASPNATNYKGTTVLMYAKAGAVRTGDLSCVSLLLRKGADPTRRDHAGKSVVDYARDEKAFEVVAALRRELSY